MGSVRRPEEAQFVRALGLGDCVLYVVGSIVGSGIFLSAGNIVRKVPHPGWILLVWVLGGIHALAAGLTYAELGARRPGAGGPYDYIGETFGTFPAFLYTWAFVFVMQACTAAALSTGFAEFLGAFFPAIGTQVPAFALGPLKVSEGQLVAVVISFSFTAWNILGIREGGTLNNVLTTVKIGSLLALAGFGLTASHAKLPSFSAPPVSGPLLISAGGALAGVLWAYDGWVNISALGAEVKNPGRDIPGGLWGGVLLVTGLYLSANLVYLASAPLADLGASPRAAETAVRFLFGPGAARWLSAAVLVSVAGSLAANIIPAPRIAWAAALDGRLPAAFGRIHPRYATPAFGLMFQALLGGVLTLSGNFDQLVATVASAGTIFYALGGAAIFVYRRRQPDAPWKMPGYPFVPILYVGASAIFAIAMIVDVPLDALRGAVILAVGAAFYVWQERKRRGVNPRKPVS